MARKKRGGLGSALLWLLLGGIMLLLSLSALNFTGGLKDADDLGERPKATALVQTCVKEGPLSWSGLGYWWSCATVVTTEDGETYQRQFGSSQFDPEDEGKEFPLAGAGQSSDNWERTDVPGNKVAVIAVAGFLIGGLLSVVMAWRRFRG